jgi:hypothetical protein
VSETPLRTLQIGNDWFGDRQCGLNRVYSELLKHLPAAGVDVRGLVLGSSNVVLTDGAVTAFAAAVVLLRRRFIVLSNAFRSELVCRYGVPEDLVRLVPRGIDSDRFNDRVTRAQSLEGSGMITLESLASGAPVLVTPIGGLPEVIRPFSLECVLADTLTGAIPEALDRFLCGTQSLPANHACRAYAVANVDWPVIVTRTRRVYEEALA